MAAIPGRLAVAAPYRALLSACEKQVALPNINPSCYHALAIVLSVLFLYAQTPLHKILIIGVVLLADWLDGATARRYNRVQRSGYLVDVVTDRASEAFIFLAGSEIAVGQVFFLLWLANSALVFYSIRSKKHVSLPLRFAYLVILIAQGA